MAIKDLEKERAKFAFKYVTQGKDIYSNTKEIKFEDLNIKHNVYKDDKYKSYVKKIPMMILNNGLGATFAFIYSKQKSYDKKSKKEAGEQKNPKNAYDLIYTQTHSWLKECEFKNNNDDFMDWIINQESQEYRATTNEVLALFGWLKRFADGMIEDRKDGEG